MSIEQKQLEERVAELERQVATLTAAAAPEAATGFAEEGHPAITADAPNDKPGSQSLEQRVARLEAEVAELKTANPADNRTDVEAWRVTMGCFKDDPEYEKAILAGAAWRRRAR